jgi:hypothetical protein
MTPNSTPGQLDQRALTFDDMSGLAFLYTNNSTTAGFATLKGTVLNASTGIFGAHVVAIDSNGTAIASTLSDVDGSYFIPFLPAGTYRIVAEPLDGPVFEADVGGNPTSWFYQLDTAFSTTYYGDVADLTHALTKNVFAGRTASLVDIHVLSATSLNLMSPGTFAGRIAIGGQSNLTVGGAGIVSGDTFSSSSSAMALGAPVFGGSLSANSPTSAALSVTASSTVVAGPKNIAVTQGGLTSILSGGLVVTNAPPSTIQVAPSSGTTDGGLQVTVTGQNFGTGAQVYFGGLLASNITSVDSRTIRATTPINSGGPSTVVVVNPDGTWGAQPQAFVYAPVTPLISTVSPLTGSPATIVQIQGTGFDTGIQNVAVQFNGTPATVISASRTSIQAAVPYNATSGAISVTILGQTATGPSFTISPASVSTNVPTFSFVDASAAAGGTVLTMADPDDSAALVPLPFTFTLFDKTYPAGTMISVSTNGWVSLDAVTAPYFQSVTLPGATAQAMIAPYFDDLFVRAGGNVMVRTLGTSPNRQFVIEWSNVGILDQNGADRGATLTFEAVLYESSNDIQFVYQSVTGPDSDASTATIGFQNSARNKAVLVSYDQSTVSTGFKVAYQFTNGNYILMNGVPSTFSISPTGVTSFVTSGSSKNLTVGYAATQQSSGATASGVAIFGFRPNGVLVTEAAVPSSGLIQSGRIYAFVGNSVDTGIAIANPNPSPATVTFNFTDANGNDFGAGTAVVPANGQLAKFIDQAPFNAPSTVLGTMTFTSSAPVSVIALRGLTNERNEFLITTLPVVNLSSPPLSSTATVPHFADGGGWATQIVLVNPANTTMSGTIQFVGSDGTALSSSPFTIPPRTSFRYATSGAGTAIQTGSVRVVPATGNNTPVALAIFSFKSAGITVSEAGAPAVSGTALRTYVEGSGNLGAIGSIQSGLALANVTGSAVNVTLKVSDLSGNPVATTSLPIAANSQVARFLNQIFSTVPQSLQGMLEITSSAPGVAAVGLRGRYNERGDFLITTMPMIDETVPITGEQFFPHLATGGGYTTQFVLFSGTTGQTASGSLVFTGQDGSSLNIVLNKQ